MLERLSIRQVLSCLRINVFDPDTSAFIADEADSFAKYSIQRPPLFLCLFLFLGMTLTVLFSFLAFRNESYPIWALIFIFYFVHLKVPSLLIRLFSWACVLSCALLLIEDVFAYSNTLAILLSFLFLIFAGRKREQAYKQISLGIIFCLVTGYALFIGYPQHALTLIVFLFSSLGVFEFSCPVRFCEARKAGVIFLLFSIICVFIYEVGVLTGHLPLANVESIPFIFMLQNGVLVLTLWKEMDIRERKICFWIGAFLFSTAFFDSLGISGSVCLLFLAFLSDSKPIAIVGSILFILFSLVFVLSLHFDFFQAGVGLLAFGCFLGMMQARLRLIIEQGEGGK